MGLTTDGLVKAPMGIVFTSVDGRDTAGAGRDHEFAPLLLRET